MPRKRAPIAHKRGCPHACEGGTVEVQRPLTAEQLASLSEHACLEISRAGAQGYLCGACGLIYLREPYLDIPLGRLAAWRDAEHGGRSGSEGG